MVRPAGLLGVFIGGLNEISDPSWIIGVADVEDLQSGVKEGDDQDFAVVIGRAQVDIDSWPERPDAAVELCAALWLGLLGLELWGAFAPIR